jgi:macrolide transport system ATP-binding/permease protein
MRTGRRWWSRLLGLLGAGRADEDMAAEFESHVAMLADELRRSGMSEEQALRAAQLRFGNLESAKESYRDQRGLPGVESFFQDARFAVRSFAKRPGFTLIAVLSLGLGIGVTTTIYTWLKAVYFNPLPGVRDARNLVTINAAYKEREGYSNSYEDFVYIRDHAGLFDGIFAHEMVSHALSDGTSAEMTNGGIVSANYFDVLGTPLALGRGFRPDEDEVLDRNPVVVLSYDLWQRRFGGRSDVIGRRVQLNRVPFTVVGVSAPGFGGVYGGLRQDYWIPMHMARALDPAHVDTLSKGSWMQVMGRPKRGVATEAIQSRLDVLSAQMRQSFRKGDPDYRAEVYPLHRSQRGLHSGLFDMVRVLAIAVSILLLLACLNVANLLLARAGERTREISVRLSLGAPRIRIVRQLLTESILLALAGGVGGLVLAFWSRGLPSYLSFPGIELVLNTSFDWTVFAFLFGLSLATAVFFGLVPALETTRVRLTDSLKEGGGQVTAGRRRSWLRRVLVIAEVSLSTTALAAAALFGAYLQQVTHAERGFRSENLLTAGVDLFAAGVPEERGRVIYRQAAENLSATPGIESAAWTSFLPLSGFGGGNFRPLDVPGYAVEAGHHLSVTVDTVSAGYLRTLGIPLEKGREFEWSDDSRSAPVVLVNHAFAERYLPKQEPVGAQVKIGETWRRIVGVHRDYLYRQPGAADPAVFLPVLQDYAPDLNIVVRTKIEPSFAAAPLRQVLRQADPNIPVFRIMTEDAILGYRFSDAAISTAVLSVFGTFACILAAIGLYGVLATFVNQRSREFGVRTAMGATPNDLRRLVLGQSTRLTLIGLAIGIVLSIGVSRLLESQLYGMKPDHFIYLWAALGIGVVAVLSTVYPVRRVARLDPMTALRCE